MDRREDQHFVELAFELRKEVFASVAIKQHHITNAQLEYKMELITILIRREIGGNCCHKHIVS